MVTQSGVGADAGVARVAGPIEPDQVPLWVPGRPTVSSPQRGWGGVTVRGYAYESSDVQVPPLRDYTIVAYRRGDTVMRRRVDGEAGDWSTERLGPGDVSLLTRAVDSHWIWTDPIDVVHVYLTAGELTGVCREMFDREVDDVALHDTIRADDPGIHALAMRIADEAVQGDAGSTLMVEALTCQLGVTVLRHHADVRFREASGGSLTARQVTAVREYVRAHLADRLTLDELAAVVGLSKHHFARRFRAATGTTPHGMVVAERLAHMRTLLERTRTPLLDVASICGFADQSHMNRLARRHLGTTPRTIRGGA